MKTRRTLALVVLAYLPFAALCVVLYLFSSMSHPAFPRFLIKVPHYDKLVHFCAFALMGISSALAVGFRTKSLGAKTLLEAFLMAIVYGVIDEVHQSYVPFRDPSIPDLIADALGAFFGAYLMLAAMTKKAPEWRY